MIILYVKPNFSQGLYHIYNYMGNAGAAFEIKCLIYGINGFNVYYD